MIAVIASRCAESAFRYTVLFRSLGLQTLAVRETAPMLSCIQDARSGLLLIEDGFAPNPSTSAHALINLVRSIPGPKAQLPIIRVWKGPVLASGQESTLVATVNAPVTGQALMEAMQSIGLGGEFRTGV